MPARDALLVVDVQNDFCPGGALSVAEGDQVVPVLNEYIERFKAAGLPVIATRDWHPPATRHFKTGGGVWPPHCVQKTPGAEFHPDLVLPEDVVIVSKGMDPNEDSYSAFEAADDSGIKLGELLRRQGIERLFIGGLATDYCVKYTAWDAIREGFKVVLLEDAMRGVDLKPDESAQAVAELVRAGVEKRRVAYLKLPSGG